MRFGSFDAFRHLAICWIVLLLKKWEGLSLGDEVVGEKTGWVKGVVKWYLEKFGGGGGGC